MFRGFASSAASILRGSSPSWLASRSAIAAAPSWRPALASASAPSSPLIISLYPPQPPPQTGAIRNRSNRSRRGLYDGKDVRFGNNVPFSMKKTRRRWNPNVQHKRIYSEVLDEMIKFHVTTAALRTIDKMGGLDNYLLRSKHVSTKGEGEGQRIRNRIVQVMKHRKQLKKQALANGESVEHWDKIKLVGKKIKQSSPSVATEEA